MNARRMLVSLLATGLFAGEVFAGDIADTFERIVTDHQIVERATRSRSAVEAMGRATRDAYRLLLLQPEDAAKLDAADHHALGACHEALGELDQSIARYLAALAKNAEPRTHLALVRVYADSGDLVAAEKHFAAVLKLQPEYPNLGEFRNVLARGYERARDWTNAAGQLQVYLAYAHALQAGSPASPVSRARVAAVERRLSRARGFDEMLGGQAPQLKVAAWIQGQPVKLAELRGKVVIVDNFALVSAASRDRIERLQQIQKKYGAQGVEIIGVSRPLKYRYNAETDRGRIDPELTQQAEAAGILAYAQKHGVGYRLGLAAKPSDDEPGGDLAGASLVVDRAGVVRLILPVSATDADVLEETVQQLIQ